MFKTLKNALKVKDIRMKLLYTFAILLVVRLGSQLPLPGTDSEVIKSIMASFNLVSLARLQAAPLRACRYLR